MWQVLRIVVWIIFVAIAIAGGDFNVLVADPSVQKPPPFPSLTKGLASRYAQVAMESILKESPHFPVAVHGTRVRHTRKIHPVFFGCYDWHSAVHNHWLLVRLL